VIKKMANLHIYLHTCNMVDNNQFVFMVKSADTADLKSADLNRSWGFKSPSGHQVSTLECAICSAF
jgi:hypothetical protein